jgi:hypothetical protein
MEAMWATAWSHLLLRFTVIPEKRPLFEKSGAKFLPRLALLMSSLRGDFRCSTKGNQDTSYCLCLYSDHFMNLKSDCSFRKPEMIKAALVLLQLQNIETG